MMPSAEAQTAPAVVAQQEGFVDAHGVLIYYLSLGSGSPLMVVHGGPGADHTYFFAVSSAVGKEAPIDFYR
jgi:proline iminopeptidase